MSDPATGPIRLGYPSSPQTALDILASAGLTGDQAVLAPYDLADPFSALRGGELDVLVVKFGPQESDLATSTVLGLEPRAAVVGAGHPLAGRDSVSLEELADYEAFERPGAFPEYLWDQIVPRRTPRGRTIHRGHRVDTIAEMMALVMNAGAVHISVASLADVAPPAIRIIPIHDLPPTQVRLAWRRGAGLPPQVAGFIAAAQAAAAAPVAAGR
ncbi:LysR substrate-binding domain-containing protein [Streptomyces sp. NBC_01136]|uniref:LysR substrate-binding domain-containing protein n=1 Tax=unclassified Streptomyces TaxID=2593676 RepID=UPI0032455271|nr:LysR substrate-binding domain-containing protein [Streptomyces sp. NBC_01136]WST81174.1 LysR substrate-binding domain-containing protein [Streptomyces sp. NBC_01136]